jgi:hypothetical protein
MSGKVSKTWKSFERCVAAWFNAARASLSGSNGKVTRSDTLHPKLFIECKYGKRIAPWKLWLETAEKARVEGKIPVLALKQTGEHGFLLVVHCDDWEVVYGSRRGD